MRVNWFTLRKAHNIIAAYSEKAKLPYPIVGLNCCPSWLYGESGWMDGNPILDLNLKNHRTWVEVEDTVAHELTHLKHPGLGHGQKFDELTETLLRRNTAKPERGIVVSDPRRIERRLYPSNSSLA